jgi:hypothetical protein
VDAVLLAPRPDGPPADRLPGAHLRQQLDPRPDRRDALLCQHRAQQGADRHAAVDHLGRAAARGDLPAARGLRRDPRRRQLRLHPTRTSPIRAAAAARSCAAISRVRGGTATEPAGPAGSTCW